ncbi:MAG: hypothetical protein PHS96_02705 [Anaerolineales bacterium]|nr:hypothetical protein [Anaerolineales bacterium]
MRDLRRYARQTNTRLIAGAILLLFVVGLGLIALFYGPGAAGMGLVCLLLGLSPLVLIWLALSLVEWAARRGNSE